MTETSDGTKDEKQKDVSTKESQDDYEMDNSSKVDDKSPDSTSVNNMDSNSSVDETANNDSNNDSTKDAQGGNNEINNEDDDDNSGGGRDNDDNTSNDDNSTTTQIQNEEYAKKSTISALVIGLVIAVGAAAFFAGAYITDMDKQDQITQQDIDDAVAKLELKVLQQQLAENQQIQQQQQQQQIVKISADDDPVIGDPNAPITIIEFSDFECPFCERFSEQTLPLIQEEYIDKGLVKLVYRDFPLQNIHPNAVITALAAECADDQGAFKGMHDILFANRNEWSRADSQSIVGILVNYANAIEIDTDEFESCVVMGTHIDDIRKDIEDGRAYGITGTPGFYVGNDDIGYVQITGAQPFESFKRVIDAQLGS